MYVRSYLYLTQGTTLFWGRGGNSLKHVFKRKAYSGHSVNKICSCAFVHVRYVSVGATSEPGVYVLICFYSSLSAVKGRSRLPIFLVCKPDKRTTRRCFTEQRGNVSCMCSCHSQAGTTNSTCTFRLICLCHSKAAGQINSSFIQPQRNSLVCFCGTILCQSVFGDSSY